MADWTSMLNYFDRVAIIHLPQRVDRFSSLKRELERIGLDIHGAKVTLPEAPVPQELNGFPSRGVYGNFLSHLAIVEKAYNDGLESVLVLEDDVIFRRSFNRSPSAMARYLRSEPWHQLFIGHSITDPLPFSSSGLVRFHGSFFWAHCYAVHRRVMPRLIEYMHGTITRPAGDPLGGKMYIDGAYSLFRELNPDVVCLLSSPRLSIQRGSASSLSNSTWSSGTLLSETVTETARYVRDELWRIGLIEVAPKASSNMNIIRSVVPWPDR
jgi:glycosyl transferase family 25